MNEKLLNINSWAEFILADGVLRYKNKVVIGNNRKLKRRLVDTTDDSCVSENLGFQNSFKRVKSFFYWPLMKQLVKQVVEECDTYKKAKIERVAYPGLL